MQSTSEDGSPLSYSWSVPQGSPSAAITGWNTATPAVTFPLTHISTHAASFHLFVGLPRLRVRAPLQSWNRQVSRVPLPNFGVTSVGEAVLRLLGGHYPSVVAPTDSCAKPSDSPLLRHSLVRGVFAGCY